MGDVGPIGKVGDDGECDPFVLSEVYKNIGDLKDEVKKFLLFCLRFINVLMIFLFSELKENILLHFSHR